MAGKAKTSATTGLRESTDPRMHFDIYAILEGTQELYFGSEVAVNVNLVETVKLIDADGGEMEKCYISPTKRRGVERRTLIWAPTKQGSLLGDREGCGIPGTCARQECPICSVFGALEAGEKMLIGRLTHGGGVAVQALLPEQKQRAMHPATVSNTEISKNSPTPFKREYNEPALLYPVYNHCLSITDREFESVAYAFLNGISRLGAGNPKGVRIAEAQLSSDHDEPLLVVDLYLAPLGKRPAISPLITKRNEAIEEFSKAALGIYEGQLVDGKNEQQNGMFTRWIGNAALRELQSRSIGFVSNVLQGESTRVAATTG